MKVSPSARGQEDLVESSIPWLKKIPSNWRTQKVKYLFTERVQKGFPGEPLLAATQTQGVVRKEMYETRTVTAQKDLHFLKLVQVGDFVISLRSFQGGIEYAHNRGIISPAYTILKPRPAISPRFFAYLLKSKPFVDSLSLFVTGIREGQNIDYTKFSRSELPVPPLEEQIKIVNFIQQQDHRIRRLIKNKKRLIEVIREKSERNILKLLFQGSKTESKLVASGIAWCPLIPDHWSVLRCRYLFREIDKRSVDGSEQHLSMSQKFGLVPNSRIEERRLISESYAGGKLVELGDLVLNRLKAHLGVFAVANDCGVISPDYSVFRRTRSINVRYFEAILRTTLCRVELRRLTKGIVQGFWRLYSDDFFNIKLPVPPLEEQNEIITLMDLSLAESLKGVDKIESEIRVIQEYRSRLIADAVTGKIDLRHIPLEPAEESPEEGLSDISENGFDADAEIGADEDELLEEPAHAN